MLRLAYVWLGCSAPIRLIVEAVECFYVSIFTGSAMAALDPWLHVSLKSSFGFPVPVHRGLLGFHGLH